MFNWILDMPLSVTLYICRKFYGLLVRKKKGFMKYKEIPVKVRAT